MPKPAAGKKHDAKTEARLGIFWLVDGKLLIESAPLSECEQYGDHLNYPGSHIRVWERWQEFGKAPAETEYEEYARGRVMYGTNANTFHPSCRSLHPEAQRTDREDQEGIAPTEANLAGNRLATIAASIVCTATRTMRNSTLAITISKSKYMAGVQCLKRLYLLVHQPELGTWQDRLRFCADGAGPRSRQTCSPAISGWR